MTRMLMTRMLSLGARIGAVLVALLLVGGCERAADRLKQEIAATQNPWPKSSALHDPADRMLRRLIVDERYLTRIKQAGSKDKAAVAGAQLALDGIGRLPRPMLERRAQLLAAMLRGMPVEKCALIARAATASDIAQVGRTLFNELEKRPSQDIDFWFEMSYQASLAELEQRPATPATEQQIAEATEALLASMADESTRARAMAVLSRMDTAPAADVCWASLMLLDAASSTVPEPHRGTLAWLMAQQ